MIVRHPNIHFLSKIFFMVKWTYKAFLFLCNDLFLYHCVISQEML